MTIFINYNNEIRIQSNIYILHNLNLFKSVIAWNISDTSLNKLN
jgi:hypothetical protein